MANPGLLPMPTCVDLLGLAERWANAAGSTLAFWPMGQRLAPELVAEQGCGLLACALSLRDTLSTSSDFAQAIEDLGLEPVGQDAKGPGA
jgi:hypothetical protein